jgi:cystatin-A/B
MNCKDGVCQLKASSEPESDVPMPLPSATSEWLMYGADWCGFCRKAKKLLKKEEKSTFVDVEKYGGGTKVKSILADRIGSHNTIPIIFFNEKFVGGFTELKAYCEKTEQKRVCGGTSHTKPMTDDVKELCEKVKPEVENSFGKVFTTYFPHSYKSQVVAGMNYFAKVKIDEEEFMHVKIYKHFSKEAIYISHQHPKGEHDEIEYF